jgi:hypothetical protein
MVKFKFFVHCAGWAAGGYENTHYAETAKEAKARIDAWNAQRPNGVTLLSIEEVSNQEFAQDYIY